MYICVYVCVCVCVSINLLQLTQLIHSQFYTTLRTLQKDIKSEKMIDTVIGFSYGRRVSRNGLRMVGHRAMRFLQKL